VDADRSSIIAAFFDAASESWDEAHGPSSVRAREFAARIRYLRALCRRFERPRVLELGCGTGQNLIHIADLVSTGVGLDLSPAMVARARVNAEALVNAEERPLRFAVGDAMQLDGPDAPFDIVLFIGTLEHLADPGAALGRARRALGADGRLVVIMPHPWNPLVALRRLLGRTGAEPPSHHLSPQRLAALAAGHGLGLAALRALPYAPWPHANRPLPLWESEGSTEDSSARGCAPTPSPRPSPTRGEGDNRVPAFTNLLKERLSCFLRGAYAAEFRPLSPILTLGDG
jgi:SAM-dependent methyltransferase